MAYQINNYTDKKTGAALAAAYAHIQSVNINKAQTAARVQFDIYASQAARVAKKNPISQQAVNFTDVVGSSTAFTSNFLTAPPAQSALPRAATSVADLVLAQAYVALKTHPDTAALLAAAVTV